MARRKTKAASVADPSTASSSQTITGTPPVRADRKRTQPKPTTPAAQHLQPVERPVDFKGIEQLIFVDASTLKDHPDNWKIHTKRQLDALDTEFSTVGWVLPLVYNKRTGRLLDGHGRKRTDYARQKKIVPVVIGSWPPEEEDQIMLHLDPIGGMFETEGAKFRALMDRHKTATASLTESLSQHQQESMKQVNDALVLHQEAIDYGAPASFLPDPTLYDEGKTSVTGHTDARKDVLDIESADDTIPGMYGLKLFEELPFNCFGELAAYGIPPLVPELLASIPPSLQTWVGPETPEGDAYFYIYGCAAIEKVRSNKLIVAFYTYDRKFESVWNDPRKFTARMINFKVHSAITPNYSPWEGCPFWLDVYQTARARWLGRYWQATGQLRVIPDMALSNLQDNERLQVRLAGMPRELPAIAIQVQQKGESNPEGYYAQRRANLLKLLKHLHPSQILLYHGPDLPGNWCVGIDKSIEIIPVKSWMWERGKVLKEKEYLTETT